MRRRSSWGRPRVLPSRDTRRAHRVLETSQPPAYYLPVEDVRTDLLVPTGDWADIGVAHQSLGGTDSYVFSRTKLFRDEERPSVTIFISAWDHPGSAVVSVGSIGCTGSPQVGVPCIFAVFRASRAARRMPRETDFTNSSTCFFDQHWPMRRSVGRPYVLASSL
mgnify:CR=1 FL=1